MEAESQTRAHDTKGKPSPEELQHSGDRSETSPILSLGSTAAIPNHERDVGLPKLLDMVSEATLTPRDLRCHQGWHPSTRW